jgi:hypothetical protein
LSKFIENTRIPVLKSVLKHLLANMKEFEGFDDEDRNKLCK